MSPENNSLKNKSPDFANNASMVCFEYDRLARSDFAHGTDFDYLLAQDLPCFQIQFKQGQPWLYVRHYLAVIGLPSGYELEILPKITEPNLTFEKQIAHTRNWVHTMLSDTLSQINAQALDIPSAGAGSDAYKAPEVQQSYLESHPTKWHEWLTQQYLERLRTVSALNPRHYQTQAVNSPKAGGKLNIKTQIKQNWHRPHYRASEQTQLMGYELLWQFLLTAYEQLEVSDKQMGKHYCQPLSDNSVVSDIRQKSSNSQPLPLNQWQITHTQLLRDISLWRQQLNPVQFADIEQAIAWAWWLMRPVLSRDDSFELSGHTWQADSGQLPKQVFMLNMNVLFEQWVSICVGRWRAINLPNSRMVTQQSFDWLQIESQTSQDTAGNEWLNKMAITDTTSSHKKLIQRMRPDICIMGADYNVSHVIEVKYKQLEALNNITGTDLYQLNSYQQHLQAKEAWLIYPKSGSLSQRHDLSSTGKSSTGKREGVSTAISLIPFCVSQAKIII